MKRRAVLLLAGTPAVLPLPALAQPPRLGRVFRVGWLSASAAPRGNPVFAGLQRGLRERGYRDGEDLIVEYRKADGNAGRLPALAAELAQVPVDVIVAVGAEAALRAALQTRDTLPIVMLAIDYDPLARGFIDSLARPGGRITGMYFMQSLLMSKRMALLKTALPELTRVVVLHDGHTANQLRPTTAAAEALGLTLGAVALDDPPYDFDRALDAARAMGAQALVVLSSPVFFGQRQQLVEATVKYKMPAVFHFGYYAKAGGLLAYGVDLPDMCRYVAATHVDRILRGADPADLPVEQPTQFELVVNLKTAESLGLTLPPSILLQASEVIE